MKHIPTTRLFIPEVRPKIVPRTQLIEQLNAGLHRKLTLVSAPAGIGCLFTVVTFFLMAGRAIMISQVTFIGELFLHLWLLIKGINVDRRKERALETESF